MRLYPIILLALAATSVSPYGTSLKIRAALRDLPVDTPVSALVVLTDQADLSGASAYDGRPAKARYVYNQLRAAVLASQGPLQSWLQSQGYSFHSLYLLNAISLDGVPAGALDTIAARPEVAAVIPNPTVLQAEADSLTTTGPGVEAGIARTGAPSVWSQLGARGQGVVVGGNDTGVMWNHPALVRQYRGSAATQHPGSSKLGAADHSLSWHDAIRAALRTDGPNPCGFDLAVPCDDLGHGTHTMGTMVGDDGQGNQIGMAPAAQWIACRSMDRGAGTPASYLECFEFFLAPYPQSHDPLAEGQPELGADIINNSWGCAESEGCINQDFLPAFDALAAAGVLIVAAAGNSGPDCGTAADGIGRFGGSAILAVGANDPATGEIASFSSRGPFPSGGGTPDLLAPGVNIVSSTFDGGYSNPGWSGTSMASPHVAGAAALVISARPELSGQPEAVANLMRQGARAVSDPAGCGGLSPTAVPNDAAGFGELDLPRALGL